MTEREGEPVLDDGVHVLTEIASQPDCWAEAVSTAKQVADVLPARGARAAVIGCGTSLHIATAIAVARESAGHGETDAFPASEMPARPYDVVLAVSRSGTTTEVLQALQRMPRSAHTIGITADPSTPIADAVDELITLAFADERSIVQTRFATTVLALLRSHVGHDLDPVIAQARSVLSEQVDERFVDREHYVFLARDWALGIGAEAALKVREAASAWSEFYPMLEFRHGPMSAAGEGSLVWLLGEADDALVRDIEPTGALVVTSDLDPMAELIRAQRVAVATAQRRGLDPDRPRHLTRSVIIPD